MGSDTFGRVQSGIPTQRPGPETVILGVRAIRDHPLATANANPRAISTACISAIKVCIGCYGVGAEAKDGVGAEAKDAKTALNAPEGSKVQANPMAVKSILGGKGIRG